MKLFPAKCHERATLPKLWRQTGNSSLLPGQQFTVDRCCTWWLESQCGFQKFCFCFVLLYNKSLNDWSLGEQWILFPSNLNVSLDFVSGNKIHCSPRDQSLSVNCCMTSGRNEKYATFVAYSIQHNISTDGSDLPCKFKSMLGKSHLMFCRFFHVQNLFCPKKIDSHIVLVQNRKYDLK